MSKTHPQEDIRELAALFAAGALSPDESQAFERRVQDGDPQVVMALREVQGAVEALVATVPGITPAPALRSELLERIAASQRTTGAQVWKRWKPEAENSEMVLRRADEGGWEATEVAGVEIRKLYVDTPRNQFTALVRMAPGTAWPRHRHDGPEECYVLQGSLRVGEEIMHAGDYQFAPADSCHGVQSTESGCLLLIVSSLSDEMV